MGLRGREFLVFGEPGLVLENKAWTLSKRVVSQGVGPRLVGIWRGRGVPGFGLWELAIPGLGIVGRLGYTLNPKPYTLNLWDSRVLNPPIGLRGSCFRAWVGGGGE